MSDERDKATGTTGGAPGTTADTAAGGSVTTPAGGSAGADTLTVEELRRMHEETQARVVELERKNQQLLSEKSNVEREREAAREAMQRAGQVPPTPGAAATPFDEEISALQQAGQEIMGALSADPTNTLLRAQASTTGHALRQATRQRDAWLQEQRFSEMRREVFALPEAIRAKVAAKLDSGEYMTVQAAREAVEGAGASTELAEVRKRVEALEAENKRLRETGPIVDLSASLAGSGGTQVGAREMTMDEWRRVQQGDPAEAARALADYEAGKVRLRR